MQAGSPLAHLTGVRATMRAASDRPDLPVNIKRDLKTVNAMLRLYCREHHGRPRGTICQDCAALARYATDRLSNCPFGPRKTTCRTCTIHCYRPDERAAIRVVMRETGSRMLIRHPWLALRHLWVERQPPPVLARKTRHA